MRTISDIFLQLFEPVSGSALSKRPESTLFRFPESRISGKIRISKDTVKHSEPFLHAFSVGIHRQCRKSPVYGRGDIQTGTLRAVLQGRIVMAGKTERTAYVACREFGRGYTVLRQGIVSGIGKEPYIQMDIGADRLRRGPDDPDAIGQSPQFTGSAFYRRNSRYCPGYGVKTEIYFLEFEIFGTDIRSRGPGDDSTHSVRCRNQGFLALVHAP